MALKWSMHVYGAKINNASLLPIVPFFFWNFRPPALLEIIGIIYKFKINKKLIWILI